MTIKDFTTKGVNGIRYEFFTEKTYAGKPRAVAHAGTGTRLHKCNIWHCNCVDLDAGSQQHLGYACLPANVTRADIQNEFLLGD